MRRPICLPAAAILAASAVLGTFATSATAQEAAVVAPSPAGTASPPGLVDPAADPAPVPITIEAPLEAPPPPPRRKGVVLESRLGALVFLGDFRHLAPPAPWWHVDVGYELVKWLAVFGYGEVSFTDTSGSQGPSNASAFPIYGFGGGLRGTVHATPRVAFFLEGDAGAMRADVPRGALVDLGFANAESFGLSFGGRLGVEWYQVDRHLAFGLDVGLRDATGFAEQFIGTSPPLMLDASAAVRYTF